MRYLLSTSLKEELSPRMTYLYDVFHLYFSSIKKDGFIHLKPMGAFDCSVLFIVGHNNNVFNYVRDNYNLITEDIIVLITCADEYYCSTLPSGKTIYASNSIKNDFTTLYEGQEFGFLFNIS